MGKQNDVVLASQFILAFQKETQERFTVHALFNDSNLYKDCLRRGLLSGDPQLVELSARINQAEGFALSAQSGAGIRADEWETLKKCAIEVSGPIGGVLVQKVRQKAPASLPLAIEAIATGLGEPGKRFRALVIDPAR